MFLKKIEINGFKSFAKKTVLDFSGAGVFNGGKNIGITAIVGPNGSGKSNIADALRWAMGEQSMKNLRGKKNHDVIFAGSGKKAQLGSAQVSFCLDNADKKIPVDYDEIIITRKVYRDGEGEYMINGSRVRLIDVVDMLAKAGVGQRSYCIINQGMADQMLNAGPLERRSIIEEAAGVKEYQVKKERSERKLKNTKNNLERVRGLLAEIEPHLKILKRQSQRAEKGEKYRLELKEKQNELFGYWWNNFLKEEEKLLEKEGGLSRETILMQREIDGIREKLNKESKNSTLIDEKIDKLEQEQRKINHDVNTLERDILIEEGRLSLARERQAGFRAVETMPVNSSLIKDRLDSIKKSYRQLADKLKNAQTITDLTEIKKMADLVDREICELLTGIEKGKMEKRKSDKEINQWQENFRSQVEKISENIFKLKKEKKDLVGKLKALSEEIEELVQRDRQERRDSIKMEDLIRRKQFDLEREKDKYNEIKIELMKIRVRKEDLEKRIKQEMNIQPNNLACPKIEPDVKNLEKEIFRLKSQLEQIGSIDEMVLEEYKETQERYDFLSRELIDLEQAIRSLQKVIKEMDDKIKDKFEETFKNINKKFQEYFKTIFNGGKAELSRVELRTRIRKGDEGEGVEDPIIQEDESEGEEKFQMGIEITAVPPGKKITNLGMLSGGERTLTSLALLFAIISFNPPPFAILDEVEAALDEANSKRFGKILRQLSGKTQFILVTHNRQTMREAAVLYGVTMNDDGASQLLSIKLEQVGEEGEIKE
ncbi:MAG: AAA family ATPase [Candidatus Moranbacteria bacterium]|nr:AAA family ATPase [Candidatus Moranbacteria bacterium]